MKPRPEVQLAAMEGRLVDAETAVAELRAALAELSKRLDENDRKWLTLEAYGSYRKVQRPNRLPDTGEV